MGARLGAGLKPLARVAGTTLLERAVATLRSAGIERVLVVVGHAKEDVRRFVAERRLDVELVENDDFVRGNGTSALAGGRAAGGRFVLLMVDHVFDPSAVRGVLERSEPFVAAVDSQPRYCDVAEATKMRIEGGRVVAVGRELEPHDAVDAGLFVCDAHVLLSAERCLEDGEGSWNAVKRRCLREGSQIAAVDLAGSFWIDVDTPDELRQAERLLVDRAAGKPWDGPVSRLLNRRLSRPISRVVVRRDLSPNAVTVAAFVLSLVAATALALGAVWAVALVVGGLLVQLSSVVDGVDGEVARASLRTSPRGSFLDTVLDRVGDAALVAALAVATGGDTATLAVAGAALFGALAVPFVKAAFTASFGRPFPESAARIGVGRDVRLLLVAVSAVALQPFWGLVALAVLANAEAVRRFVVGWRSSRPPKPAPEGAGVSRAAHREAATVAAPKAYGENSPT
jgi:choline kinase/phosphatidylglycerophosphate synthase